MEDEIRVIRQNLLEDINQERQKGLEETNSERVKLNDEISQASKAERLIRNDSQVHKDTLIAQNGYKIQCVRDAIVSVVYMPVVDSNTSYDYSLIV